MEDCENILEVHMELSYKLEKFEGPLDLLLHLIEKNKVNIYDIPIAEITDQYMEYVRQLFFFKQKTAYEIESKAFICASFEI